MTPEEITTAKARLAELQAEDKKLQLQLEVSMADIEAATGRLQAASQEWNDLQAEWSGRLKSLAADVKGLGVVRQAHLDARLTLKREYGVLFEQVGIAERAAEREAEKKAAEAK